MTASASSTILNDFRDDGFVESVEWEIPNETLLVRFHPVITSYDEAQSVLFDLLEEDLGRVQMRTTEMANQFTVEAQLR